MTNEKELQSDTDLTLSSSNDPKNRPDSEWTDEKMKIPRFTTDKFFVPTFRLGLQTIRHVLGPSCQLVEFILQLNHKKGVMQIECLLQNSG